MRQISSAEVGQVSEPRSGKKALTHKLRLSDTVAAAADLLAEGDRAHAGVSEDARDLLLDDIAPDPDQPRRHFDDNELKWLADDIQRRGVLQPILVRPPIDHGAPYRLVAGERRWRAAKLAGRVRIPARIRDLTDDEVQAAQLAENVLRADLNDFEKGRALRRLYEMRKTVNPKTTWEDIADEVGLGKARITDLFNLAALPTEIAFLIESGRLSGSHGIALQRAQLSVPPEDLLALACRASRPEGKRSGGYALSVAQLRKAIQELLTPTVISTPTVADQVPMEASPFVADTLSALRARRLSEEEIRLLEAALAEARESNSR